MLRSDDFLLESGADFSRAISSELDIFKVFAGTAGTKKPASLFRPELSSSSGHGLRATCKVKGFNPRRPSSFVPPRVLDAVSGGVMYT